ncbi:MAG TPA: hypothetical protein VFP59_11430 [Candidatus Angelobacter sp.]|nr:hypothetical protein [Candidatus Angelobacter sp.]
MYVNAGRLFKNALEIARGTPSNNPAVQTARDALTSILFAAMSVETFINELHHMTHNGMPTASTNLKVLGDLLEEAERSRSSVAAKYQFAKFILSGQAFDKGASPYQDFSLLLDLRNLIVHAKPLEAKMQKDSSGRVSWVEPKIMVRLQSMGLLEITDFQRENTPDTEMLISDLIAEISTQRIATWACESAAAIITDILDAVPAEFAPLTDVFYRRDFTLAQIPQEIQPSPSAAGPREKGSA